MPKRATELSALQVKRLTKAGFHAVGVVPGLHLQVGPSGSRSWVLRAMVGAKRRDIGLGGFPAVTLAQARDVAREMREKIRHGVDPVAERKAARRALMAAQALEITFAEAARQCHAARAHEFKNLKHRADWLSSLERHAFPSIGRLQVAEVGLAHIVRLLEPIWIEKTETATRVRQRIESVLSWATVHGYRTGDNPARWQGHLDAVLPTPSKLTRVQHHRALPVAEVGGFIRDLRKRQGTAARALEFAILTAARSGEIRFAPWDEFDLAERRWTIPAERMKGGREHRVPLSDDAIAVLKALPRRDDSPFVFPAARGGALSDMSISAVTRRMKVDAVPHGMRSTFRDWCAENTAYPRDVAEMALAHAIPDAVEAAYRRGDLYAKRTRMMDEWSKFCSIVPVDADVVPLHKQPQRVS